MPAFPRTVTIHDVSESGCRLEMRGAQIEVGGTTLFEVPGAQSIAGRIVWTHGNVAGVQFDQPLSRAAAIAMGLIEPEPEPVAVETAAPARPQGLLHHWLRRQTA